MTYEKEKKKEKKKKKYQTLAFSQTHKKDTGIKIEDSTKIYI